MKDRILFGAFCYKGEHIHDFHNFYKGSHILSFEITVLDFEKSAFLVERHRVILSKRRFCSTLDAARRRK